MRWWGHMAHTSTVVQPDMQNLINPSCGTSCKITRAVPFTRVRVLKVKDRLRNVLDWRGMKQPGAKCIGWHWSESLCTQGYYILGPRWNSSVWVSGQFHTHASFLIFAMVVLGLCTKTFVMAGRYVWDKEASCHIPAFRQFKGKMPIYYSCNFPVSSELHNSKNTHI